MREILLGAESKRRDKLESSPKVSSSQSFLLYKGCSMTKEHIREWAENVGK